MRLEQENHRLEKALVNMSSKMDGINQAMDQKMRAMEKRLADQQQNTMEMLDAKINQARYNYYEDFNNKTYNYRK